MQNYFLCSHKDRSVYVAESGGRVGYVFNPTSEHPRVDYEYNVASLSKELDLGDLTGDPKAMQVLSFELLRRFVNFNEVGSDDEEARLP